MRMSERKRETFSKRLFLAVMEKEQSFSGKQSLLRSSPVDFDQKMCIATEQKLPKINNKKC